MKALKSFDIVTALIVLAGRIAKRRHEKLVAREASLKAAIAATKLPISRPSRIACRPTGVTKTSPE
ncbi:hypothetical protein VO98_120 [Pseudomonas phage phiPsa17]|uniref:Uncharacterized protein n=1 Tax=Pseudomonas phage phiPsa17 TaxID=1629654 RepID=A0A0G2T4I7_9CAUD|nr:hypothetical protein HOQ98_gp24 [Pseudomonas phage phiPsa17]AKG94366.1 hypothetical protein VO98_120 [Pseudomonas phage phiPsa17]